MENDFRSEIAGLRAVAIISVVLFHLKVGGFRGGFVGVDVFFVISGYLITRNILRDLQTGRFSLDQFYVRRARRIFPALIFTVALTYLLGALWCAPLMFLDLAKEATHALLSISNIQYWRESHQYFAPNSDELALLHFWSLSLEEQFYLVWPLLLILANKAGRSFQVIAIAALASFFGSIIIAKADPLAAFFLMPFRIFEFAIGAVVLRLETKLRPGDAASEGLSAAGIICVVIGVLLFDSDMAHLDLAILLPCLGTAATIWAGGKTRASRLLTNRPMIAIGTISYSLYLCHWPIIFFARFIFGDQANTLLGALTMTATMSAVATAMYVLIERGFIQPSGSQLPGFRVTAIALWSVLLTFAAITHLTFLSKGFSWRLPKAQSDLAHLQDFPSSGDLTGPERPVGALLVGDSLVGQYAYGLLPILRQLNISFEAAGDAGCPILYGATLSKSVRRDECQMARDRALQQLGKTTLPVIYTQLWRLYDDASIDYASDETAPARPIKGSFKKLQQALAVTIEKLIAQGHRVLIVGAQQDPGCSINVPRLQQGPLAHAPQPPCPSISWKQADRATAPIDRVLASIQAKWPDNVGYFRPIDYFCDPDCPVVKNGVWLFNSRIHLSLAGSDYLMGRSQDVFRKFLEQRR